VTGQVNFGSHYDTPVRLAATLVNALTPGEAGGRRYSTPQGHAQLRAVTDALSTVNADPTSVTSADVERLAAHAIILRAVFTAVAADDLDGACHHVNELLDHTKAQARLVRHDGQPWHLHYHGTAGGTAGVWAGTCASGLAIVLGSDARHRLGVCTAPGCDRVYVDTSHNGSRRFCSVTCQNRVKTAAYRARAQS
jgi:predicted RNA-binding Zn ribbon-like protein